MARVAVIGAGYVGLTSAACLSHLGHDVVCADIDEARIEQLRRVELPIHEDGLADLVAQGLATERLEFVLGADTAVPGAELVLLCLPTPQGADGAADLTALRSAATQIAPYLDPGAVVVTKSTVPVGSTLIVAELIGRDDVAVVSNPEFLREGSAVHDFLNPSRVVIGCDDEAAGARVAELYQAVDAPVLVTDPASSETIKYASNAFLAVKLSYVNAIAAVCEALGADIDAVVEGMGFDDRIGRSYLRPGPGWGGSCLPKDIQALVRMAHEAGYDFDLLQAAADVNADQLERTVSKVLDLLGGSIVDSTVTVLGLAFKAGTDDTRYSPAVELIRRLAQAGAKIRAYDPVATIDADGVTLLDDPYRASDGADVLVVATEWDEFRSLDLARLRATMRHARVVDTRGVLDRAQLDAHGFEHRVIGHGRR